MTKLNQIIAVEKDVKAKAHRDLTDAYHKVQKAPPLSGITRNYRPKDEDGDQLPTEQTLVQIKIEDILRDVSDSLTRLFDVTLTKDVTNAEAKADVKVDGTTLLEEVPVTYLLFLEKQLAELRTFVSKLPTLDPSETWGHNAATGTWATTPTETTRTKKIPRNWVKAPATEQHPAQVDVYHEDVVVGYWTTIKFSGALPADRVNQLVTRVDRLVEAVKFARESANSAEVVDRRDGRIVFDYLFGT